MKQRIGAAFLAGLLVAALVVVVILPRFFQQAVYRSMQPSSVAYHSYDPYLLTINERGQLDYPTTLQALSAFYRQGLRFY